MVSLDCSFWLRPRDVLMHVKNVLLLLSYFDFYVKIRHFIVLFEWFWVSWYKLEREVHYEAWYLYRASFTFDPKKLKWASTNPTCDKQTKKWLNFGQHEYPTYKEHETIRIFLHNKTLTRETFILCYTKSNLYNYCEWYDFLLLFSCQTKWIKFNLNSLTLVRK